MYIADIQQQPTTYVFYLSTPGLLGGDVLLLMMYPTSIPTVMINVHRTNVTDIAAAIIVTWRLGFVSLSVCVPAN